MIATTQNAPQNRSFLASPWVQLIVGVVCMVMIANLQYGWTFFVPDIQKKFGWERSAIQVAFTLFVLFETWLVPIEGWFVDKYGPRIVIFVGGVLCGIAWVMNSYADTLAMFYAAQVIGGIGAGGVYGTCIGNALKWFPGRRGLAAGITAAGFGAGSALTVVPIIAMIKNSGFQAAFFNFGIGQGVIVCIFAFLMFAPKPGQVPEVAGQAAVFQSRRQFAPNEIIGPNSWWIIGAVIALVGGLGMWAAGAAFYIPLALAGLIFLLGGWVVVSKGQPVFMLMYFMFVLVGAGGLIVTANLAPISLDLKVSTNPVTVLWMTMPALTFAATHRSGLEWAHPAVLRLGLGPHRPGKHDVHRLLPRRPGHIRVVQARRRPVLFRRIERCRVLRLGRDLQPLSVDLHRHVRHQIRNDQCRTSIYGEGHGLASGSLREQHHRRRPGVGIWCSSSRRQPTSSPRFSPSQS